MPKKTQFFQLFKKVMERNIPNVHIMHFQWATFDNVN